MASAGTTYVDVVPEFSDFESALASELSGLDGTVQVDAEADVSAAQAEIDGLTADSVTAEVDADTSTAQGEIDALDGGTVTEDVEVDTSGAESSISGLGDSLSEMTSGLNDLTGESGGAGAALDGLAGAALGSSGALAGVGLAGGGAAAAFGFMVDKASEAQVVTAQTGALLATAGDSAGVTAGHIEELGMRIEDYSGFSHVAVDSGQNMLLMLQNVSSEASVQAGVYDRTVAASANLATVTGDVSSAMSLLGRAVDDPAKGVMRLRRAKVQLTQAEIDNIKSLQESGDLLGAQEALLSAVESRTNGLAAAYGQTFSGEVEIAKQKLSDLAEVGGSAVLPMLTNLAEATSNASTAFGALGDNSGLSLGRLTFMATGLEQTAQVLNGLSSFSLDPFGGGVDSTGRLTKSLQDLSSTVTATGIDLSTLSQDITAYEQGIFGAADAEDAFTQAQFAMLTSLAQNGAAITGNSLAAINNRQHLEALVTTTGQRITQLRTQGASEEAVASAQSQAIGVINRMAERYGWTREQVARYTSAIRGIPGAASTTITQPHMPAAQLDTRVYLDMLAEAKRPVNTRIYADASQAERVIRDLEARYQSFTLQGAGHAAMGGPVEGATVVGELGPEIVSFGQTAHVTAAPETARILQGREGNRGGDTIVNINAPVFGVDHLKRTVHEAVREADRVLR